MSMEPPISDSDRYPTLSEPGREMLRFLREHPAAPIFRNQSGNRLTADDVEAVLRFEREVADATITRRRGERPNWVDDFVARSFADVPYYRGYGSPPTRFEDIPTIGRGDLGGDIAAFVPDGLPLDRVINFRTSGTTGHPLLMPSHPVVAASYLTFHKSALRRVGIELTAGTGQVGVVLLGHQRRCFTYVSVTPTMGESGLAKINLHPNDWNHPDDRARYLDAMESEVFAGDPISFSVLLDLPVAARPRAILCTSMMLLPGLRQRLEARFQCPVIDIYSMNEAGPIAAAAAAEEPHALLQPGMYVEVLDSDGEPAPAGERGEVTLTGGFNPYLPLLRYRTGDWAGLRYDHPVPVLTDLEGRPPVLFRTTADEWINNIEVTHALQRFALPQYTLAQDATGALVFSLLESHGQTENVRTALVKLFGTGLPLSFDLVESFDGKVVQYTSELRPDDH